MKIKEFSFRLLCEEKIIVNVSFGKIDFRDPIQSIPIKSDFLMKNDNPLNLKPGDTLLVEYEECTTKTSKEVNTEVAYNVVYFDDYLIKLENVIK